MAIIFKKEKVKKLVDAGSNKLKDGIDKISDTAQQVMAEEKQSVETKLVPVDLDGKPVMPNQQNISDAVRDSIQDIKPKVLDRTPYLATVTKPVFAVDEAYRSDLAQI